MVSSAQVHDLAARRQRTERAAVEQVRRQHQPASAG